MTIHCGCDYWSAQIHTHTTTCWEPCPDCGDQRHSMEGDMHCQECGQLVFLTVPERISRHDCQPRVGAP